MKLFRNNPLMASLGAAYVDKARRALLEKGSGREAQLIDQLLTQVVWTIENEYGEASKVKTNGQPQHEQQEQQA